MIHVRNSLLLVLIMFAGTAGISLQAQDTDDTSLMEDIRNLFKNEALNVGTLVQVSGTYDFDEEGSKSFYLPNARLKVDGKLDEGFSYAIQFDVADDPVLLDAQIGYKAHPGFQITAGAQKPGISGEFLTGPQDIDFVSRSQVVQALIKSRDIGVRVHGNLDNGFGYSAGMFNGNGLSPNNDDKFYYAARMDYKTDFMDGTRLNIGANGSYGQQENNRIANGVVPPINGDYVIFGGDLRIENEGFILDTEALSALVDYNTVGDNFDDTIFGYQVTGGFKFAQQAHFLVRWDSFNSENTEFLNNDELVIGLNYLPSDQTKIRLNYIFPPEEAEIGNHRIVANFQIGF